METRTEEIRELLMEMKETNFAQEVLKLPDGVQIDHENAVLMGHSMGGGGIVKAAQDVPEFKAIVTQDEIMLPMLSTIEASDKPFTYNKPWLHQSSMNWHDTALDPLKLDSKGLYKKFALCNEHPVNTFRMFKTIQHDFFSDEVYSDPLFWMFSEDAVPYRTDYVHVMQVFQYDAILWLSEQGITPGNGINSDFMKAEIKRYDPKGDLIVEHPKFEKETK